MYFLPPHFCFTLFFGMFPSPHLYLQDSSQSLYSVCSLPWFCSLRVPDTSFGPCQSIYCILPCVVVIYSCMLAFHWNCKLLEIEKHVSHILEAWSLLFCMFHCCGTHWGCLNHSHLSSLINENLRSINISPLSSPLILQIPNMIFIMSIIDWPLSFLLFFVYYIFMRQWNSSLALGLADPTRCVFRLKLL